MSVKVQYKGYDLHFPSLPDAEQIVRAYEEVRFAVCASLVTDARPSIPLASRNSEIPLSYIQESLWLREQMGAPGAVYNLPAAVRLSGALDLTALNRTITEIVRRHEVLRTVFPTTNGLPCQVVMSASPVELPINCLPALASFELDLMLQRQVEDEIRIVFDVENGPLFRGRLVRLSEEDHVLVMTFHHLIYDAWSAGILLREMATLYEAYSKGKQSSLPPLPLHYADFAIWQRRHKDDELMHDIMDFWRGHLSGAPLLILPTDFPRPSASGSAGARHPFQFPPDLTTSLKHFAKCEGVTLFTLMLAIFQLLLAKYSGQDDIVIGVPFAGRTHVELENLIGCFINVLPVRTTIRGRLSFRELLHAVQNVTQKVAGNQDVPLEKILKAVSPARSVSGLPIYQVLFDFVNVPSHEVQVSGLIMTPVTADTGAAKMDLLVDMWEAGQEIVGQFEYRRDLFKPATIAAIARSFMSLSANVIAQPETRVAELDTRTPEEKLGEATARKSLEELNHSKLVRTQPKPATV